MGKTTFDKDCVQRIIPNEYHQMEKINLDFKYYRVLDFLCFLNFGLDLTLVISRGELAYRYNNTCKTIQKIIDVLVENELISCEISTREYGKIFYKINFNKENISISIEKEKERNREIDRRFKIERPPEGEGHKYVSMAEEMGVRYLLMCGFRL
jgi:hypothetical protein